MDFGHRGSPGTAFLALSREYLSGEYLPKIRRALEGLTLQDIWWRPNRASNSIGNLVLHLAGNSRQWVVAGIGGQPDTRERQAEFDAREGAGRDELLSLLEETLAEVDAVLAGIREESLEEERNVQGLPGTVLSAVYHVVEHFSMHTGQILYLSKLRTGTDLGFYRETDGKISTDW